jgi:DNA-3-methyladenine glycosylase I
VTTCSWALGSADYLAYHDDEWGVPLRDDVALFERLSLEAFQSGLSWLTILRKRSHFREAFVGFDPVAVSEFEETEIQQLLQNAGIIRHRGKIEACINNAQRLTEQWEHHGTSWLTDTLMEASPSEASLREQGFVRPPQDMYQLPSQSRETLLLAKRLKGLGFRFLGPVTLYSALQATGFVHDHVRDCPKFEGERF